MNTIRSIMLLCTMVFVVGFARADEPLSDEAVKTKIVDFVTLPSRLCGKATMDFRAELRARKLTNREWFDGDTNRLARLIAELAQTNDVELSSMMINGKNVPVLYDETESNLQKDLSHGWPVVQYTPTSSGRTVLHCASPWVLLIQ